ncbi:carbohydrate-binding module family 35 protein [Xylariaceae sp. FL0594]|nr:carbohydrate-binding module family 35 protein [Xylariaceae sp. FL0594]
MTITTLPSLLASAILAAAAAPAHAKLHKIPTPPMGWNSYNYYGCNPSEAIIKSNAQGLVDLGLAALGYDHVTTDCGWMTNARDEQGRLQWNRTLFPSGGGRELGDYLHGLGLKFGLYSGAGYFQCGSTDLPASLGYEEIDAQSFADWGGDTLKYDNCYSVSKTNMVDYQSPGATSPARFQKMASVLDSLSHNISYFICQWGVGTQLGQWAPPIGNIYRISNDIYDSWRSIWRITNQVVPFYRSTKPGAFPDMDMLVVGLGGLSREEERFHFSMWTINKSPLKIGAPALPNITPHEAFDILGNTEVIAINQDSLSKQARLVRRYTEEEWDVWAGELSGSRMVLGVANWRNDTQTVKVNLASALNVSRAAARDVWAKKDLGVISDAYEVQLKGHEMKVLVLSDIVRASSVPRSAGYYSVANSTLSGGAAKVACSVQQCKPVGTKVSMPSGGASAVFDNVVVKTNRAGGRVLLGVDHINYELALGTAWGWGSNTRNMTVAVNGGKPKRWAFPISGGDWWESDRLFIEVDGFHTGRNKVVFGVSGSAPAPDLVGFEVFE